MRHFKKSDLLLAVASHLWISSALPDGFEILGRMLRQQIRRLDDAVHKKLTCSAKEWFAANAQAELLPNSGSHGKGTVLDRLG